jgi:chromosome segregation ATPase
MESQDIDYLIHKYSGTSNSSPGEDYYSKTPRSSFSPFRDPSSKAYASAMRALQERIRYLESENLNIYEKYRICDSNLQEQKNLVQRLNQEISSSGQYTNDIISNLKQDLLKSKKEITLLQNQISNFSNSQFYALEQENLQLKKELDQALRDFNIKKSQENSLAVQNRKLEEEKYILQEELAKEKWNAQEMHHEYNEIRKKLDNFKHKQYEDKELQRQNEYYIKTIKDLEKHCRYLEDLNESKSGSIKKLQDSTKSSKASQKTVSFRNNRSKSSKSIKGRSKSTSPSSPRISRPTNRHIGAHLLEEDIPEKMSRLI